MPFQLREGFVWCERNALDPLVGVQRAHVEMYIRSLGERGLMDSSVVSMMNGVRGFFRFAHIDGVIAADTCTPGCRKFSVTSRAPKALTGSS
jgi:integrase/recombinase XerD